MAGGARIAHLARALKHFSASRSPAVGTPVGPMLALKAAAAPAARMAKEQLRGFSSSAARPTAVWEAVPLGPPDAILGIVEAFKADQHQDKINLGVGAYRDNSGKPLLLECVRRAEQEILTSYKDKEYTGIAGLPEFTKASALLAYGSSCTPLKANRIAVAQSLSGTGALRLGAEMLARFYPLVKSSSPSRQQKEPSGERLVYLPNPTWANHGNVFRDAGLGVASYRYFDKKTNGLDLPGMLEDLSAAPNGSIILLHACAHNPTGVDPRPDQWQQISDAIKSKQHYVFFDMAYQGFASGSPDTDAFAVRKFVSEGHEIMLAQSYAKNMGLYGERIGALSIVCHTESQRHAVESQLKIIIRPMYSNPPIHGARLVSTILNTPELHSLWLTEVKKMADRIATMRASLQHALVQDFKSVHPWNHITDQIGMFCYTGLSPVQSERLTSEFHVYLPKDGRISIAGITPQNVNYLAKAIHQVTK